VLFDSRWRWPIGAFTRGSSSGCDVLEEQWILSEQAAEDVGLRAAINAYVGLGAPAPEADGSGPDASRSDSASRVGLDIDWSSGWEAATLDEALEGDALEDEALADDDGRPAPAP
jgi:hypothetical protein